MSPLNQVRVTLVATGLEDFALDLGNVAVPAAAEAAAEAAAMMRNPHQ